jgi:hypothetical protein
MSPKISAAVKLHIIYSHIQQLLQFGMEICAPPLRALSLTNILSHSPFCTLTTPCCVFVTWHVLSVLSQGTWMDSGRMRFRKHFCLCFRFLALAFHPYCS